MPNMSYCKFENTYKDLLQCYHDIETANNESEKLYRERLLSLCQEILSEYGDYEFIDDDDDDDFQTFNEAPYGQD